MSYLPAPYESPQQDDLAASVAAILTTTVGLISAWVFGQHVYPTVREFIDGILGNLTTAQENDFASSMQTLAVPTIGWAVSSLLLVIGSLLLLFRRGRGLLIFSSLISIATTAYAQFGLGFGGADAEVPVSQWPLYWGGVLVLLLAALPATGRWVGRTGRSGKPSTVIGTTESGAVLWPGM
ncbi:MAG: hypothetical protein ABJD68_08245 [Nakamurella sp.]